MIGVIVFVGCIASVVALLIGLMHVLVEERFPRPIFLVYVSWWWPFRSPSAATLAAELLDADDDCDQWVECASYTRALEHKELKFRASFDYSGGISFSQANENVPLTAWDDFVLGSAMRGWQRRERRAKRVKARRDAAARVREVLRKRTA